MERLGEPESMADAIGLTRLEGERDLEESSWKRRSMGCELPWPWSRRDWRSEREESEIGGDGREWRESSSSATIREMATSSMAMGYGSEWFVGKVSVSLSANFESMLSRLF